MAIHPTQPDIKAEILVNGEPLKEYEDDEEPPPNTVTKYIEAISGANFVVRHSFNEGFNSGEGIRVKIELDGKRVSGFVHRPIKFGHQGLTKLTDGLHTYVNKKWYRQKLRFSELTIGDSAKIQVDRKLKDRLRNIGCISVSFYRITNLRQVQPSEGSFAQQHTVTDTVPENTLKGDALSHQGGFDAPKVVKRRNVFKSDFKDNNMTPFVKLNFRYRSLESLKAMCIVPRTPTPVPLEERPAKELTQQELVELVERMRDREAKAHFIKKEMKREHPKNEPVSGDEEEVTFLEQRSSKRQRRAPTSTDAVIELD